MSISFLSSNDSFTSSTDSVECKKMNVFGNGRNPLLIKSDESSYSMSSISMPSIYPVKPTNELSPNYSKPYNKPFNKPYLVNG